MSVWKMNLLFVLFKLSIKLLSRHHVEAKCQVNLNLIRHVNIFVLVRDEKVIINGFKSV